MLAQGDLTLSSAEIVAHFLDFTSGHRKYPADPRKPPPFTKESRYKSRRSIYEKFHAHYTHDGFKVHLLAKSGHSHDRREELRLPGWAGVRRHEPARARPPPRALSHDVRGKRATWRQTIFATIEWSDNIFWYVLKGAKNFRLNKARMRLAQVASPSPSPPPAAPAARCTPADPRGPSADVACASGVPARAR